MVFCETTYQLLNSLNLIASVYKEECTICLPQTMRTSSIAIRLKEGEAGYIKKVYYGRWNIQQRTLIQKILFKLHRMIVGNDRGYIRSVYPDIDPEKKYSRIICSKNGVFAASFYNLCTHKPDIIQIEDGLGDYLPIPNESDPTILSITKEKFSWEPDLLPQRDGYPVRKMPRLSQEKAFLDMLERVFGYREILPQYKKFIYFGQPYASDYDMPTFADRDKKCFSLFSRTVRDQLSVKLHPRSAGDTEICGSMIRTLVPWECCIGELEDLDNRVLIAVSSTTLLMPKFMWGKEPYLIILARLYEDLLSCLYAETGYYQRMLRFFEQVRGLYSQPEKVFIPRDFQELKEILLMLQKKEPRNKRKDSP